MPLFRELTDYHVATAMVEGVVFGTWSGCERNGRIDVDSSKEVAIIVGAWWESIVTTWNGRNTNAT